MEQKFLRKDLKDLKPYLVDKNKFEIRLDANESFLKPEEALIDQMCTAVKELLYNRYPDPDSSKVCDLYSCYAGIKTDEIMAGNGSDELIQVIINTFLNKNEKVMVLKPDFSMYSFYTKLAGGELVEFDMDENFQINKKQFLENIKLENPKLIFLSNPNNPTGRILEKDYLIRILELTKGLVVVDEAYTEFFGESLTSKINEYSNLIILRTCSKAFGIAAVRLGFVIANSKSIKLLKSVKSPFNVNSVTQKLGEIMLSNLSGVKKNIASIIGEREYLIEALRNFQGIEVFETHANFILVRLKEAQELNNDLQKGGIKVRDFKAGKLENCLRITVGSREENQKILGVINKFINRGEL